PIPWLLLGVFEALYFVPLGIAVMLLQRLPGWPVWTAAAWVAEEALRGRVPWGGFTWGKLAFSQIEGPLLDLAAIGGSVLVTFAVALAGGLLAWAAPRRPLWHQAAAVAAAGGVVASGVVVPVSTGSGEQTTVAVVQGNTPGQGLDFLGRRRAVLENHVDATHRLADRVAAGETPQPDLVIWPENSSDISPFHDAEASDDISGAVDAIGVPTLVGAVVPTEDEQNVENTSIVWQSGDGAGETYVKRHPMPFGEYIPFRSIAEMIAPDAVARQPRDFVAGDEVGTLNVAGAQVGPVICFEVAFDNLVRDVIRDGANLLAVQTNNAGFGYAPMTEQQLGMARLRAVEHGRWTVVAALAGVSALVDPSGDVQQRMELFTQDTMVAEVELLDGRTVATTVGEWPEWLLTAGALLALAVVGWRTRREGRANADSAREAAPLTVEV
ncbi:MAG: apolipoprotein N-acyltransferase, partial [Actinomycetota bacterium]